MKDLKTCLWKKSLEAEIELLRNNKVSVSWFGLSWLRLLLN